MPPPLTEPLQTGQCIVLEGDAVPWYIRLSGTTVYLYRSTNVKGTANRTIGRARLLRVGSAAARDKKDDASATKSSESSSSSKDDETPEDHVPLPSPPTPPPPPPPPPPSPQKRGGRVPSRFLYVARDLALDAADRRIKIGISGNIPQTIGQYRRRVPQDAIVVIADCETEPCARALEAAFKLEFAEFREGTSEVYNVRPHEVERALRRRKYKQCPLGVFRQQ